MMRSLIPARRLARAILMFGVAATLAACGGDDPPTPPPLPGTLAVVTSPTTVAVVAGASGTSAATITRGGSFSGSVALSAEGAPAGATVTFGTPTLGAGVTSSTITIATAATVTAGSYPIAIKATGTGVSVAAATITLTVSSGTTPTVAVSVAPASASIVAGASGTSTATIVRGGGFAGDVALTSSGAPTGMTVTFTPATVPANATTSSIAVATAATVTPGTYSLIVNAAGTGVTTATSTLSVTVTAPPVSGNAISITYCAADAPIWLAFQDGTTGSWTRVTPNTGTTTYQFNTVNAKVAVASVDTAGTGFDLNVIYATASELNGFGSALGLGQCGTKRVNGSVANVSATQAAFVTLGYSTTFASPAVATTFQLTGVAAGPQDLFAARILAATQRADKFILRRGLDVANNGTIPVLDFNASEAFNPATANVTLANLGADSATVSTLFTGTRGSAFGFVGTITDYVAGSGAVAYDAIPGAQLNAGELQALFATTTGTSSSRSGGIYFRTPATQTVTFGPALSTPTLTRIAGGNYARVQAQLPLQSDYARSFTATFSQTGSNREASITVTSGYSSGGAWDVTIPAISGNGWLDTWGLLNGTPITWSIAANGGALFLLDTTVPDGTTFRSAQRSSTTPLP